MTWPLKRLKNLDFNLSLLGKVYNVWPKRIQKNCLSRHWRVMQNWRKFDLRFRKWYDEFAKFHQNTWKCLNRDFDWTLLSKIQNTFSWQWRMVKNMKRNWLVSSKLTGRIWEVLTRLLKNLKTLYFNGTFFKYITFELKKNREVIFDGREDWCKIWKKWLVFPKITWEIWQIFIRTLQSLKIGTLMEYLYPK